MLQREGGAGLDFDLLSRPLTDEHVVHLSRIAGDLLVHLVAGYADGGGDDDSAHGDHGDFGGATPDVDDHGASGLHDRQAGPDCGGHRLLYQVGGARASVEGGFVNRPLLHLRYAGRNAYGHPRPRQPEAGTVVNGADEVMQHLLRDVEVGDNSVPEGPHCHDIGGGAADHSLGLSTDGQDLLIDPIDGDHRRLVDDDAATLDHYQGVGSPQIDGHIMGKYA